MVLKRQVSSVPHQPPSRLFGVLKSSGVRRSDASHLPTLAIIELVYSELKLFSTVKVPCKEPLTGTTDTGAAIATSAFPQDS